MSKKYKGFKGSGMKPTKTPKYKIDRILQGYMAEFLARPFLKNKERNKE